MVIDFSALNDLTNDTPDTTSTPAKEPIDESKENIALQRESQFKAKEIERANAILKEYQENRKEATSLIGEITKDIQSGENIYKVFLKAIKTIGILTNDSSMYDRMEKDALTVYGFVLEEPESLEIVIEQLQERLDKLKEALASGCTHDQEKRIKTAIKRHEDDINQLKELKENGL